jgi:hypothetical protein
MEREVLTPDRPRWPTFIEGLESWLSECGCGPMRGEPTHKHAANHHGRAGMSADNNSQRIEVTQAQSIALPPIACPHCGQPPSP